MRLFLCGDVMTGRGIDQALPHPVHPNLYEPYVRDAREYVALSEKANGPIPRPLSFEYIWGDALRELERAEVDLRIANLETAVTSAETPWPEKGIHYRMHPQNIGCLTAAQISACALANNHVLDWGYDGLSETLKTLTRQASRTQARVTIPKKQCNRQCSIRLPMVACYYFHLHQQAAVSRKIGRPPAFRLE